ncbi:uncharacterized protein LOC134275884 [Saccostrea cucullata]|uniref:uncharacterized protein LOC134275884 n=1 Tax=Saccostrea cuccullata TaxID=36930 RepID=UPI002ED333A0
MKLHVASFFNTFFEHILQDLPSFQGQDIVKCSNCSQFAQRYCNDCCKSHCEDCAQKHHCGEEHTLEDAKSKIQTEIMKEEPDDKDDMLGSISREYRDYLIKRRDYLEPQKVNERQATAARDVGHPKDYGGSHLPLSAVEFRSSSSGAGYNQIASPKNPQCLPNSSMCVKVLQRDAKGSDEYLVGGSLRVHIYQENIIELVNISVLVCGEGRDQHGQGFLAKQILEKATKNQKKDISKLFKEANHIQWSQTEGLDMLWKTTSNILEKANKKKKKVKPLSIAMPLLGTSSIKNTEYLQQYADVVCHSILDFSKQIDQNPRLQEIHLVNHNAPATEALKKAFAAVQENKQDITRRR